MGRTSNVTDKQIFDAVEKYGSNARAGEHLGIAGKTVSNRMSMIRKAVPSDDRPDTYQHDTEIKRYFISSVVSDAPLNQKLYASVQHLCEHLGAEQIYIPVEYDWQDIKAGRHVPSYPKKTKSNMLSSDIPLNDHLLLLGSVPIHATIQNPLSGLKHVSQNKSAIFAHPQRAMESVATPKHKLPKLLYTTGTMTHARYTRSKTGRKAEDLHTLGGLLVEVTDKKFHVFEITSNEVGEFYHLTTKYGPTGYSDIGRVSGIYMADEHEEHYEQEVKDATYLNDASMVNVLKPRYVVRGDVYNHGSDSHHERKNILNRIIRDSKQANSVSEELYNCALHIHETTSDFTNIIVASNHHDHLKRWLNEFDPHKGDPKNILLYHQLNAAMIEEALALGSSSVDPFEMYVRTKHPDVYKQCKFIERDEEFEIAGVDCGMHGDLGCNGSRGSVVNLTLGGKPFVIGHSHSPRIYRNGKQVGACANEMGYNKGYSGWMATHCVIYPDGNSTLIHIVDGEWRI